MEIIYLALHRLGTDRLHARLQARRPPKKQRWGGQTHLQNGTSAAWAMAKARTSVRCALESGDTKRPVTQKERYRSGAASGPPGRKRRLHGSQAFTLQKSKSLKTKSLRDLVQNSLPSACRALVARGRAEHTEHTEHRGWFCYCCDGSRRGEGRGHHPRGSRLRRPQDARRGTHTSLSTQTSRRARGSPSPCAAQRQRANWSAGLLPAAAMDAMESSAVALLMPKVIGTRRSSRGLVPSCR